MQNHGPLKFENLEKVINKLKDLLRAKNISLEVIINTARMADVILECSKRLKSLAIKVRKKIDEEKESLRALDILIMKVIKIEKCEAPGPDENCVFSEAQEILKPGKGVLLNESTIDINLKTLNCLDEMEFVLSKKKIPENYRARNKNKNEEHKEIKEHKLTETSTQVQVQKRTRTPMQKISYIMADKGKPFSIKKMKDGIKDPKKRVLILLASNKKCERCLNFTKSAIILGSGCVMCMKCMKDSATINGKLISNIYDAVSQGIDTVCVCPSHGLPISPYILQALFGGNALEKAAIEAVKSQFKNKDHPKTAQPIMCAECKRIKYIGTDKEKAKLICKRHRICITCFK